jgi:hypothetical protein
MDTRAEESTTTSREGPQVVTKHGKGDVVVVSAEECRRLRGTGPSLVEFIRTAPDFDQLELDRPPSYPQHP